MSVETNNIETGNIKANIPKTENVESKNTETKRDESNNTNLDNTEHEHKELQDVDTTFENLCFEAGGAKSIAYIGMLRELYNRGLYDKFIRFSGTSAGSIFASLMAMNYSMYEIEQLKYDLDFSSVMTHSCAVTNICNIYRTYGITDIDQLEKVIKPLIELKFNADITLAELYRKTKKELVIIVCNLNQLKPEYLHHATYPQVKLLDAILASCHIPFYFKSRQYNFNGTPLYYVDGSVVNNYAIWVYNNMDNLYMNKLYKTDKFYVNSKTLGLKLLDTNETNTYEIISTTTKISTLFDYVKTILNTIMIQNERIFVSDSYIKQTACVYTGDIHTLDFDISIPVRYDIIKRGESSMSDFLKKYEYKI
jgi:predicted acylesterase/phospholipase RssA